MGFIFGGSTGETQDSLDTKRKLALAMLAKGTDSSPIQSPWQGAARLSEALMGGLNIRRQEADQKAADAQSMALITGSPYTPPPQSGGFLSSLFGANKVPASDAQGQVAAASPGVQASPQHAEVPPDQIKALIAQNVPPELQGYATNLIGHESSFNPNAVSPTGATGLAQFTRGTGKQYGLVGPNGDQRADPVANLHALVALTNDNKAALTQALGRPPTDGELALAHQQGVGGAISLLSGKNVPSQNLAVNNIDPNSDPRAAAAKIMKFYGGAGGPQVASLDPSAGMGAPQPSPQAAYVDPQVTTAGQPPVPPAAQAIQQQAPLPGPAGQPPPQDPTQTASIGPMPPQAAPPMAAPVNIPNQPISNPQPADLRGVGMGGAAPGPGDGPARLAAAMQGAPQQAPQGNPQQQLAQAMQSAPVAPNPMRDNPRVQMLMRAMSNPNASPQMRAMVGAALQQEMARGEDAYKLQLDAYQKQQDPAYQANLKKAQYEAEHLGQISPSDQATIDIQRGKLNVEQQNADSTTGMKEYNFAKQQGYPGTFAQYELEQKAAGRPTTTINNGDNSGAFAKKADEEAATRIGGYVSEGANAAQMLGDVQQLADLGKQINTGKGAQVLLSLGPYAESLGIDIKGLGPEQAFNSIVSRLAPSMRPTGSGSSSDTDVRMFLQSLPSLGNTQDGNAMISSTLASVQQHKMAAADIASKSLIPKEQGGITWQEAESQIRKLPNPYQGFNEYRKTHQAGDAAPAPGPSGKQAPAVGSEEGGYRFKGGNPADPANWEQAL